MNRLAAILLFSFVAQAAQSRPASFPWAADARAAIQRIRESKTESMNVRLWEANKWIAPSLAKPSMDDVEAFLRAEGYKSSEGSGPYESAAHLYTIQERAITLGERIAFDWVLVVAYREPGRNSAQIPKRIYMGTTATLVASCDDRADRILGGAALPTGSALEKALGSQNVKSLLGTWPALRSITLSYGPPWDYVRYDDVTYEITITLFCALSSTERVASKSASFVMRSGLGPLSEVLPKNNVAFKCEDTLADPHKSTERESWEGDEATIEANKKKYGLEDPKKK